MTWQRNTHPTGLPYYTSPDAPGFELEAIQHHACHAGVVFGQVISNADQGVRTTGWRVVREGRSILTVTKLADAKAYVERRVAA